MGGVWGVLEFHGCPGDFSNDAENGQPWADMGWINNNSKFEFNRANDFIVDLDLDCNRVLKCLLS